MGEATDVAIAGAGPAGCIAALLLARAGARVRLFDRARFPRRKLCGDTLNPGACAILARLGLARAAEEGALRIEGMIVSSGRATVAGRYGGPTSGLAITRAVFDARLLEAAAGAGVEVDEGTLVSGVLVAGGRQASRVTGLRVARRGGQRGWVRAKVSIAADGRHSTVAFGLGLSRHPPQPRRWAIGAYYADVDGVGAMGEMHIRHRHYFGVAAVPGGLVNLCLVTQDRERLRDPEEALRSLTQEDPALRGRFSRARQASAVAMLGPLAVDCRAAGVPGLLLAGDAAGFIDPMTGDGMRFALRGAELAAAAALRALDGDARAHVTLARWRGEFRAKRAFNRALRALVDSPRAVRLASAGARLAPTVLRHVVDIAGDVGKA